MNSIIRVVILTFILFGSAKSYAQWSTDIIYLKSGTQMVGVLDSIKRDTAFFRVNGRIMVAYPMNEVEKFAMSQENGKSKKSAKQDLGIHLPDSGHFFCIQNNLSIRGITAQIGTGIRLNRMIQPMVTVEAARYIEAGGSFVSLMTGLNGDFKNGRVSPFYSVQAGYGFNLTSNSQWEYGQIKNKKGGFKMESGLGIRQRTKDGELIWHYGLSVSTQNAEYVYDRTIWNWQTNTSRIVEITENISYLRFNLKLGLVL